MKFEKKYILNPVFLLALLLLLGNDFWGKATFHNWITGKLSDFAGIAMLTLLLFSFFPRAKKTVCIAIALSFAFWKSPLMTPFIESWNALPFVDFYRVVD